MNGSSRYTDDRTAVRAASIATGLFALVLLGLTVAFVFKTLDDVAAAQTGNDAQQPRIEGTNVALLEKLMSFKEEKTSDARKIKPGLDNPFARTAEPQSPTPQDAPPPEPST